mmetsp:Transcript_9306/g.25232  ORF Transcript_9306/g.25232 Transcript_9306/m.25232 type:complete len:103 (-) Transcript_9306:516-824(-)
MLLQLQRDSTFHLLNVLMRYACARAMLLFQEVEKDSILVFVFVLIFIHFRTTELVAVQKSSPLPFVSLCADRTETEISSPSPQLVWARHRPGYEAEMFRWRV